MTPGPNEILVCTTCGEKMSSPTTCSSNTFGAIYWSDGKREAPMCPDSPWLVLCPHCQAPLWIDELKCVDKVSYRERSIKQYDDPTFDTFLSVLSSGVDASKKERYLRLKAWWKGNDSRRNEPIEMSERERDNALALAKLMDETNSNDVIMKAEIYREAKEFEKAMALIDAIESEDLAIAVTFIKKLIEQKDPFVRQLIFQA